MNPRQAVGGGTRFLPVKSSMCKGRAPPGGPKRRERLQDPAGVQRAVSLAMAGNDWAARVRMQTMWDTVTSAKRLPSKEGERHTPPLGGSPNEDKQIDWPGGRTEQSFKEPRTFSSSP